MPVLFNKVTVEGVGEMPIPVLEIYSVLRNLLASAGTGNVEGTAEIFEYGIEVIEQTTPLLKPYFDELGIEIDC